MVRAEVLEENQREVCFYVTGRLLFICQSVFLLATQVFLWEAWGRLHGSHIHKREWFECRKVG